MASHGYTPSLTSLPLATSWQPSAQERVRRIKENQEEASAAMRMAQQRMKRYADMKRRDQGGFKVGDEVWLEAGNYATDRPSQKLASKRLGPFPIEKAYSILTYRLKLPPTMRMHPVFHISQLVSKVEDTIPGRIPSPPPDPVIIGKELEYEVETILNSRYYRGWLQYLVRWKGYGEHESTWEPARNLRHSGDLLDTYHNRFPRSPGPALRRPNPPAEPRQQDPRTRLRRG